MGKPFSFIHCADLHLGEPLSGLRGGSGGPWAEALREAGNKAFENVVNIAIERKVDALLIAGDVYNSENHSLAAQIAFARELYRAALAHIEIFIVHGNHDPLESGWNAEIPMVPSVHVFSADDVEGVPIHVKNETVVMVYGMSYKTNHVTENLVRRFHKKDDKLFSIGMLHTEVGVSESPYAPCTIEDLRVAGMDYWALGHIHTRQIISTEPYIVYPGNIQGLDKSETGPRGCYLVNVGEYGTVEMEFIETDMMRWVDWSIDISSFAQVEDLWQYLNKKRSLLRGKVGHSMIVRLIFTGRSPIAHGITSPEGMEYILATLNDKEKFHHNFCYFAEIKDRTEPFIDFEKRKNLPDEIGTYLKTYESIENLSEGQKIKKIKEMIEKEPELLKYNEIRHRLSDEMLLRAFKKAKLSGVERLWEADQ